MIKKRVQLTWCAKNGTGIKQINLSFQQVCVFLSLFTFTLSLIIASVISLTFHIHKSFRIASLENDKNKLQAELISERNKIASLNQMLAKVEETTDKLRMVARLPQLDDDVRQVGVGGPVYYGGLHFTSDEVGQTVLENRLDLAKLERSIQLERSSLAEIAAKLKSNQEFIDHYPSIRPIMNGVVTDKFGWRIHPLYNRRQQHKGVDMPAPKGTPVLAAANGKVVLAKNNFTRNKNYGREVLIDHGNGYMTRYAHLNTINVRVGQKVNRWDPIGEVGDTGGTTGDHLHYEVLHQDKCVDPEYYMLN